ncbi:MAG: response regulator [Clostridiales bacterium]|jgi:putative two-component system response regulator|nr:response regulator [Clostridiales bacterium]
MEPSLKSRPKIILVDDNIANLTMGKQMLRDHYEVYTLSSAAMLFDLLKNVVPSLILLDIEMPGMNGYDAIKILKDNPATKDIPVIFVTARTDEGSELTGLSLGAIDYVQKPFSAPLLTKRIQNHLLLEERRQELLGLNADLNARVKARTNQVVGLQNAVLSTIAELVEERDNVTGDHIENTQKYLALMVARMKEMDKYAGRIDDWDSEFFISSARLHDIGKISVRDAVLLKPGRLTDEERKEMQKHVEYGVQAIDRIGANITDHAFLKYARIFCADHHEWWDGTGYPKGTAGEEISLPGRIMAIADVYEALVSSRPYKAPLTPDEAAAIIVAGRGTHFDPDLVDIFVELKERFAAVARKR